MTEPHHILLAGRLSGVRALPEDSHKTYYRTDRAYYFDPRALEHRGHGCFAEIMISQAPLEGGGTHGEYAVRFGRFSQGPAESANWMRLEVFQDGLGTLVHHADFLVALAALSRAPDADPFRSVCPTPHDVELLLQSLGYTDTTLTQRPSR